MGMQKLADFLGKAVQKARDGGIATEGVWSDGSVIINGRIYTAEVVVPLILQDGQRVVVQRNAGDDKVYVIG